MLHEHLEVGSLPVRLARIEKGTLGEETANMIQRVLSTALLGASLVFALTIQAHAGIFPCDQDGDAGSCPGSDRDTFSVPGPSTLVLLASGLGVLGWTLRRRG